MMIVQKFFLQFYEQWMIDIRNKKYICIVVIDILLVYHKSYN